MSTHKEENAIYIGINKVMAKGLEEDDQPLYPCKIENRFKCPYEKRNVPNAKFNVDDLFVLDEVAFLVELAFGHAESMTKR